MLANFKLSIFFPSLGGAKEKLKPTYILIREREKGARRQKKKNLLAVMCTCHCIAGDVSRLEEERDKKDKEEEEDEKDKREEEEEKNN